MLMDVPLSPTLQVIVGVHGCTKSPAQLGMQALKSPNSNEIEIVGLHWIKFLFLIILGVSSCGRCFIYKAIYLVRVFQT